MIPPVKQMITIIKSGIRLLAEHTDISPAARYPGKILAKNISFFHSNFCGLY